MSTRDREPDPGPLSYAPKWARTVESGEAARRNRPRRPSSEAVPLKAGQSSPPPSRPREPPPRRGRAPRGAFEGDVAIRELRERLALAPDLAPSPPLRRERGAALGMMLRLTGLATLAAIAAYGFVWISTPRPPAAGNASPGLQTFADQPDPVPAGEGNVMSPAAFWPPGSPFDAEFGAPRAPERGFPTDFPQRLPTAPRPLQDRQGDGAPSPVSPTTGTAVPLPAAGQQRPAAPDLSVSRPSPSGADREEMAALIARGQTSLANGDVVSARLVFRRAAESGDAQAALALGGTFDPIVLRSLGVIGVAADAAQARSWYQRAAELGSREAPQRLDQLAQRMR